jgi:hypothetical protein
MMTRAASVVAMLCGLLATGCGTVGKVVERDVSSGHFGGIEIGVKGVTVVKADKLDLDARKALAVVPGKAAITKSTLEKIGYFSEVIDVEELQKRVVQANLNDKVPSITDKIGLSNAGKHYRPFYFVRIESERKTGSARYDARLMITDAATLNDVFVASVEADPVWQGVNDQNTWYPLYNSAINWIRANSKTYR